MINIFDFKFIQSFFRSNSKKCSQSQKAHTALVQCGEPVSECSQIRNSGVIAFSLPHAQCHAHCVGEFTLHASVSLKFGYTLQDFEVSEFKCDQLLKCLQYVLIRLLHPALKLLDGFLAV